MDTREFRDAGHRMIDWIAEYLDAIEGRALFPKGADPAAIEKLFDEPLPLEGTPLEALMGDLDRKLVPNCCHVNHPGYFGFITPTPTPAGMLGDLLASALNQNVGAWSIGPGAVALERRVVRWLCDLAGYGPQAGGHLTSGGMMANFVGVKLARDAMSGDRAQHDGVAGRFAVYGSEERHVSVDKAVDAVGLGRNAYRALPTDDEFAVRLDALEEAITRDRRDGVTPVAIVGMAGTTNTGALDDLVGLRRIADREKLWLHVDAAYGGGMLLSERWPGLLAGIEAADSVTIDPHKWFYAPLDAGAVVVKDGAQLTRSFGLEPAYLKDDMDASGERFQYFVHSFEQSRRFRGLKVWLSFKRYGARQIGRWVDANIEQARALHELAVATGRLVPAARPRLSAICLRFEDPRLPLEKEERLHALVARRLEDAGEYWITTTRLKGRHCFRINPVNFRTRLEHMQGLLAAIVGECDRALAEGF
jgi:glutamate/tyrosine decarboxylase-like PLP-dependent enzyme